MSARVSARVSIELAAKLVVLSLPPELAAKLVVLSVPPELAAKLVVLSVPPGLAAKLVVLLEQNSCSDLDAIQSCIDSWIRALAQCSIHQ